ncbi:MAG: DUF6786 family protein [Saprospiraceae bacterium]|nr:DUF6786 family protein [Saprospiraceae bacterium]
MKWFSIVLFTFLVAALATCKGPTSNIPVIKNPNDLRQWILDETMKDYERNTFGYDLKFIRQRKTPILLHDENFKGMVLVSPDFQGRVLTSTAEGLNGYSFGWLNYDLIGSGENAEHMNAYGGEDRIWLGPEGGQFSLYFKPGSEFIFDNWQVPYGFDSENFEIISIASNEVSFFKKLNLTNYSNTILDIALSRQIKILSPAAFLFEHGLQIKDDIKGVGFESLNILRNTGQNEWNKSTGMPSIWILGMFKPSPSATVVIPYKGGAEANMGALVTDDYFGKVPGDRLKMDPNVFYFKADGHLRSKIGINTFRAKPVCGSFDEERNILTIVEFTLPDTPGEYVNSQWKIQDNPFSGDVVNAYNDGPMENGTQLGPFYEIESSSRAAQLKPGETIDHKHRTLHFMGKEASLDAISRKILGVGLNDIRNAFPQ